MTSTLGSAVLVLARFVAKTLMLFCRSAVRRTFDVRRAERVLFLAEDTNANPVIIFWFVVNKCMLVVIDGLLDPCGTGKDVVKVGPGSPSQIIECNPLA